MLRRPHRGRRRGGELGTGLAAVADNIHKDGVGTLNPSWRAQGAAPARAARTAAVPGNPGESQRHKACT